MVSKDAPSRQSFPTAHLDGRRLDGWIDLGLGRICRQASDSAVIFAVLDTALPSEYMPTITINKMIFSEDGSPVDLSSVIAMDSAELDEPAKIESIFISAFLAVEENAWVEPVLNFAAEALSEHHKLIYDRNIEFSDENGVIDASVYPILIDTSVPLLDRLCLLANAGSFEQGGWTETELRSVLAARPAAGIDTRSRRALNVQFHVLPGFVDASATKETFDFMSAFVYRTVNGTDENRPEILPSNPDPKFRTPMRELEKLASVSRLVGNVRTAVDDSAEWTRMLDRSIDVLSHISKLPAIESSLRSFELNRLIFSTVPEDVTGMVRGSMWSTCDLDTWKKATDEKMPELEMRDSISHTVIPIIYRILGGDVIATMDAVLCLPEKVRLSYYFDSEEVKTLEGWLRSVQYYATTDREIAFNWYYNLSNGGAAD